MKPTFVTAAGTCKVRLLSKSAAEEAFYTITADGAHSIPVKIGNYPSIRTIVNVPPGVIWDQDDTNGNKLSFGFGAGFYMGDIGTGFKFDALTAYPVVSFELKHGNWCFSLTDPDLVDRWTAVPDVGNGVGCLAPGYLIDINVETKTIVKGPYTKGTGAGGAGGEGGAGGSTGGSGGSAAGSGGNPGTSGATGGDDSGGCSCAVPGQSANSRWLTLGAMSLFVLLRRRGKKA